jgi:hypothetical protein
LDAVEGDWRPSKPESDCIGGVGGSAPRVFIVGEGPYCWWPESGRYSLFCCCAATKSVMMLGYSLDSTDLVVALVELAALEELNHRLHPRGLIWMEESICLSHQREVMEVVEGQ